MKSFLALLILAAAATVEAAPKQVRVFVALCDNKTQGIQPVGQKLGNGDDPDSNLYWGCSEGFDSVFRRSDRWTIKTAEKDVSTKILRRLTLVHNGSSEINLVADAYRGSEIRQCLRDFEIAAASDKFDLVAFIGHNGLMDFDLQIPSKTEGNKTEVIVLCCVSEAYFGGRLRGLGCRPVLMTQQLMYPGSFLLHAALETWLKGGSAADIREASAKAYARNQKISVRAATGVFANSL